MGTFSYGRGVDNNVIENNYISDNSKGFYIYENSVNNNIKNNLMCSRSLDTKYAVSSCLWLI